MTGAAKKSSDPPIVFANHCESAELDGDTGDDLGVGVVALLPPDDLIHLTHLHEASVVFSLRRRYAGDAIYTSTGPILLAINPFKSMPRLYGEETMAEYFHHGEFMLSVDLGASGHSGRSGSGEAGDGDSLSEEENLLPPHIYGTADYAFREMMSGLERGASTKAHDRDQSILVSGESGAGKTVTAKHIMSYLATLSQRRGLFKKNRTPMLTTKKGLIPKPGMQKRLSRKISRQESWKKGAVVEERILQANPILESFGNARTIRNDNSSRFGKFIELQFKNTGSLVGAEIETYLLEKVRLVTQSEGERNYHIFYEILAGAMEEEREQYFLGDMGLEDFRMTNQSGTYDRRDGADDMDEFDTLFSALGTMGFDPPELEDLFSVTVACMHASNVTFKSISADESEVDDDNPHLHPLLDLMGWDRNTFNKALCYFTIQAGREKHSRSMPKNKAEIGLQALIKAIYGGIFDFLVKNINLRTAYKPSAHDKAGSGKAAYIGVLDIFGFEVFKNNSFEQLCINYCNEALQQQFNRVVFKTEQVEYEKEGIEWSFIKYPDNQDVLDLIEGKGSGIIPILNDMCVAPGMKDLNFARDLYSKINNPRFEATALHVGKQHFVIHHYPCSVEYGTEGFISKNKDELPNEAQDLISSSSKLFVQKLGEIISPPEPEPPATFGRRFGKKKVRTVGGNFVTQLKKLRTRIDSTSSHYIRCLKPNQHLGPNDFNPVIVSEQLRSLGVVEAIRLSRTGFPQRFEHGLFLNRYSIIVKEKMRAVSGDEATRCEALVGLAAKKIWLVAQGNDKQSLSEDEKLALAKDVVPKDAGLQMGKTKVFLQQDAFDSLEIFRIELMDELMVRVQNVARVFLAKMQLKRLRREEEERKRREEEERKRREEEERLRREAEERARREAEEKARKEAEEKARKEAEERAKREAKEKAEKEVAELAQKAAEEKAKLEAAARAKKEAEEKAKLEAAALAKKEAEEKAQREAAALAKKEAEEKAQREAAALAKKEAEEKTQQEAAAIAKKEVVEKVQQGASDEHNEEEDKNQKLVPQAPLEAAELKQTLLDSSAPEEKVEDESDSVTEMDATASSGVASNGGYLGKKQRKHFSVRRFSKKVSTRIKGKSEKNMPRQMSFTLPPLHIGEYDVALPLTSAGFMINVGEIQGCVAFVSYRSFSDGTIGPAQKEGVIRGAGDKIVAINGINTKKKTFREVVMLLAESRAKGMAFVRLQESRYAYPGMRIQVYPPHLGSTPEE